jgi:hypothetical protein
MTADVPKTCFICGKPLDPDDFYTPVQGWTTPEREQRGKKWKCVERVVDIGFCPECVWEIETRASASPPSAAE